MDEMIQLRNKLEKELTGIEVELTMKRKAKDCPEIKFENEVRSSLINSNKSKYLFRSSQGVYAERTLVVDTDLAILANYYKRKVPCNLQEQSKLFHFIIENAKVPAIPKKNFREFYGEGPINPLRGILQDRGVQLPFPRQNIRNPGQVHTYPVQEAHRQAQFSARFTSAYEAAPISAQCVRPTGFTGTSVAWSNANPNSSVLGIPVADGSSVFGTPAGDGSFDFGTPVGDSFSVFSTPVCDRSSVFGTRVGGRSSLFSNPVGDEPSAYSTTFTDETLAFGPPLVTRPSVLGITETAPSSFQWTPVITTRSSYFGNPATAVSSVFGNPGATAFEAKDRKEQGECKADNNNNTTNVVKSSLPPVVSSYRPILPKKRKYQPSD